MVKILIGNIYTKIVGYIPDNVQSELDNILSYRVKDAHYLTSVKMKRWDGVYHLYKRNSGQSFFSGLLSLAEEVLKKHDIQFIRVDERIKPKQNLPELEFIKKDFFEERDYQELTIERAVQSSRGVLKIATGGGKTLILSQIISRLKVYPFMFYVLTEDLMHQAHDVLSETLNEPIGMVGGGIFDIKKITVCTIQTAVIALNLENKAFNINDYKYDEEDVWNSKQIESVENLKKLKELIKNARGLYLDECHHTSAATVKEVLTASPFAYWRYGGSATPYREDGAEIVIQAMFGKKIVDISASYLIKRGYLVKPYIIFDPIEDKCKMHAYSSIYKTCVSQNVDFNTRIAKIANYLLSKNLNVLVLVQHYPQGDLLKTLIPNTEFLTGKMKGKKRKNAIGDLKVGEKSCLLATTLADEGVDIPSLDVVLMAGGGASSTRVYQRIGRALRKNKTDKNKALIIYFHHDAKHLEKHAKKAKKIMKAEPLFEIVESSGGDFIFNEINQIYGFEENQQTIMNI